MAASASAPAARPPGSASRPAIPHISSAPRPRSGGTARAAVARGGGGDRRAVRRHLVDVERAASRRTAGGRRARGPVAVASSVRSERARAHRPAGRASAQRISGSSLWLGTVIVPHRAAAATSGRASSACSSARTSRPLLQLPSPARRGLSRVAVYAPPATHRDHRRTHPHRAQPRPGGSRAQPASANAANRMPPIPVSSR